jgi:hypothetical protein
MPENDPKDVCKCGDYRDQHLNGVGRCLLGELCTPERCGEFRLFQRASERRRAGKIADFAVYEDRLTRR